MKRPSPALIISLLALFVALGGTSYAVSQLPEKSVGTKQLQNGAVTAKKIKKATRKALKGKRGLRGLPGSPGAKGDPGPQGPRGEIGPSTAYVARFNGSLQTVPADTTSAGVISYTRTLPAGNYVVLVTQRALSDGTATNANCRIETDSDLLEEKNVNLGTGSDRKIVTMQANATFTTPTEVRVRCETTLGSAWSTDEGTFAAIEVGELVQDD